MSEQPQLPQFITISSSESFLISSAKSNFDSPSEYRSLVIQRLRMLTSSFKKNQLQNYYLPDHHLLQFLWNNILQCFSNQIETNNLFNSTTDSDIIDLIQYLKECTWIYIENSNIREELFFGFDMKIITSEYYNSRDESKKFHIYSEKGNIVCDFLLSHVLRNLESSSTLARCLLDYYSNLFFEECLFKIELSKMSLVRYENKYESEKHLMEYVCKYIDMLNDMFLIGGGGGGVHHDDDIIVLNNIKCISKLISALYHSSDKNIREVRRHEYKYLIDTGGNKRDVIDINLKFKLLEYFFIPCIQDEKSACKLINEVFSPYIHTKSSFQSPPTTFEEIFQFLTSRIQAKRVTTHTNSGGMTLACLYYLLSIRPESTTITTTINYLLKECKEYVAFLLNEEESGESSSFCTHVLGLIEKFTSK